MLILQLVLISLNAVFACAEIAVISINDIYLEKMKDEGNKKAARLIKLKGNPARFLATIQVAITLSGFLGSAFAADNFSDRLVGWILSSNVEIPRNILDSVCVILITLILSFVTLILGELVPKRIAMRRSEELGLALSGMIYTVSKVFAPLVSLLTACTNGILRVMGIDPNEEEEEVSEEDIVMMVDAGNIDNEEKDLIRNIFEFDDITAGEICTHRTDVRMLFLEESDEEWDNIIREGIYNRYPVCDETPDKVVGILSVKDYFKIKEPTREAVMKEAVKPAYFVPETVKADVLFKNMKRIKNFYAVVLDEHGGMTGIITLKDLIEEILGDFNDETPEIVKNEKDGESFWYILGTTPIADVEQALGITFAQTDCDTFGGYVFSELGNIPNDGETPSLETETLVIKVTEISDHQMVKSVVRLKG